MAVTWLFLRVNMGWCCERILLNSVWLHSYLLQLLLSVGQFGGQFAPVCLHLHKLSSQGGTVVFSQVEQASGFPGCGRLLAGHGFGLRGEVLKSEGKLSFHFLGLEETRVQHMWLWLLWSDWEGCQSPLWHHQRLFPGLCDVVCSIWTVKIWQCIGITAKRKLLKLEGCFL